MKTIWATPEKNALRKHFAQYLVGGRLPSLNECMNVQQQESVLKHRTTRMIKAWVFNQQKLAKKTFHVKQSWKTPEKNLVRVNFKKYLLGDKLPTLKECTALKDKFSDILQNRTAVQIKAWVNNQKK